MDNLIMKGVIMNRERAKKRSTSDGCPILMYMTRCDQEDVDRIEKMTDEDIVNHLKGLFWGNFIYGCHSRRDLEIFELVEFKIQERPNINFDELKKWADQERIYWEQHKDELENFGNDSPAPDDDTTT